MDELSSSIGACPVSPLITAVQSAQTALAIADARAPGAPLLFANAAFAALVDRDAATLVGCPVDSLSSSAPGDRPRLPTHADDASRSSRITIRRRDGELELALSTARVTSAQGTPLCLLCSLVDVRGADADAQILRDAELLREVAQAASGLMREAGVASDAAAAHGEPDSVAAIATAAMARVVGERGGARP